MTTKLIEHVKALHRDLMECPEYCRYVVAKTDEESEEGLMQYDTFTAAQMLRKAASKAGDHTIASQNTAVIGAILEAIIGRPIDWEARKVRELDDLRARLAFNGLPEELAEDIIARKRN